MKKKLNIVNNQIILPNGDKIMNRQVLVPFTKDINKKINLRYIIKEKERKIISIVKFKEICKYVNEDFDNANDSRIVINIIDEVCRENGFKAFWNVSKDIRLEMNETYIAVATCDPRDEWNEETGISIVTEKIKNKIHAAAVNRIAAAINMFTYAAKQFFA